MYYYFVDYGDIFLLIIVYLDVVWVDISGQGQRFKILLLILLDNFIGCMYLEKQLRQIVEWCIVYKVYLIVSEIYGLLLVNIEDDDIWVDYMLVMVF